jgi:hypothetical protein
MGSIESLMKRESCDDINNTIYLHPNSDELLEEKSEEKSEEVINNLVVLTLQLISNINMKDDEYYSLSFIFDKINNSKYYKYKKTYMAKLLEEFNKKFPNSNPYIQENLDDVRLYCNITYNKIKYNKNKVNKIKYNIKSSIGSLNYEVITHAPISIIDLTI